MKRLILFSTALIFALGCSKDDDNYSEPTLPNADVAVTVTTHEFPGNFEYKKFLRTELGSVRGLIILAHGDGGSIDDSTLNDQCYALAQQGFIAITTSYRNPTGTEAEINSQFVTDLNAVYFAMNGQYNIPVTKTVVGGLSRGGNLTFPLVLPGQPGLNAPSSSLKGVILECSGGDAWKGGAIVVPVAYMSNQSDDVMGMADANDFKNALLSNANPGVASKSECLIIGGQGHCGSSNQYKAFVVNKMIEWFPE